jgi:hypothetical protein
MRLSRLGGRLRTQATVGAFCLICSGEIIIGYDG